MIAAVNKQTDEDTESKLLNPTCDLKKPFKGAVYVQGAFANAATRRLFQDIGFEIAETIEDSDVVCWTGGADINPRIYGQNQAGASYWSDTRDKDDLEAIEKAGNRFKVGICRGAQLLNCVPNGGSLWQDVNKHGGSHHSVTDTVTGLGYIVNSIHHQQMIPSDKGEVVAFTSLATFKENQFKTWHHTDGVEDRDIEAVWYPETRSLCLQWHPEFGGSDSTTYFNELIERYYLAA